MSLSIPRKYIYSNRIEWGNEQGQIHRIDGPAVEYLNGAKEWWINGKYHKEDGPAIKGIDDYRCWYINGKRHREDGPAIIYGDGYKEYFLQGVKVTREHIIRLQRERIRHLVKIVLTNQLRVNKSHYIKALLPLIVKETFK